MAKAKKAAKKATKKAAKKAPAKAKKAAPKKKAAKKKKDRALRHKNIQIGYSNAYTVPKLQYSQLNNLIKKGRCTIRFMMFMICPPMIFQIPSPAGTINHYANRDSASRHGREKVIRK